MPSSLVVSPRDSTQRGRPGSSGAKTATSTWIWPRLLPDAMKPGIHGVRTHWIPGFIGFHPARNTRTVMLMVPVWPESGFRERRARAAAH